MSEPCTVVIASPNLLASLTERAGASTGEVLTFSDAEPLRALETIAKRRPRLVALERLFAISPRGAALINRIKADPNLRDAESACSLTTAIIRGSSRASPLHRRLPRISAARVVLSGSR